MRLRASFRSSSRVVRVFLMNPCNATRCLRLTQISTRAVRRDGKSVRISHNPSLKGLHSGMPVGHRHCARSESRPIAWRSTKGVTLSATPAQAHCPPSRNRKPEGFSAAAYLPPSKPFDSECTLNSTSIQEARMIPLASSGGSGTEPIEALFHNVRFDNFSAAHDRHSPQETRRRSAERS